MAEAAADGITRVTMAELVALRRQLPKRMTPPIDRAHAARAGTHASAARGRGMDYRESRAYQAGDDVRRLDRRLTARSGRLHTKLFQEERERSLLVVLDTHATMQFGTRRRFKSVQAARAAGLAAWLGIACNMRVGLAAFGPHRDLVRPTGGTRGALGLLHGLDSLGRTVDAGASAREEPLSAALRRVVHVIHGGAQVLVISDGNCTDGDARAAMVALRRRARVRVLVVADALESALVPAGRYAMSMQDRVRTLDLETHAARSGFRNALGHGADALETLVRKLDVPCRRIDTGIEPVQAVAALLGIPLHGRGR